MLSEKGNLFTAHYFESGYSQDYEDVSVPGEMVYELVADTWENYFRMRARLDSRIRAGQRTS